MSVLLRAEDIRRRIRGAIEGVLELEAASDLDRDERADRQALADELVTAINDVLSEAEALPF